MGVERPKLHRPSGLQIAPRPGGIGGPALSAEVSSGVEATSPFEDQDFRLASATTAIDDEVLEAAHDPGLSRGMSSMR